MEPIRKVTGRRAGIEPAAAAHGLWRVERRDGEDRPSDGERRPRKRPSAPSAPAVRRDADGRAHVDVQA